MWERKGKERLVVDEEKQIDLGTERNTYEQNMVQKWSETENEESSVTIFPLSSDINIYASSLYFDEKRTKICLGNFE